MTNKQLTFKFLDAPMGAGKSTAIINKVKTTHQKYLIVAPYLTEVDRICESTDCITTTSDKDKQAELFELAGTGRNICITHKLFSDIPSFYTLKALAGYSLIIDEEVPTVDVLECPKGFTSHDIADLISASYIGVTEDTHSLYAIKDKQCKGVLSALYNHLCALLVTNDIYMSGDTFIQIKKPSTWEYFKDVTICSYRMENSLINAYCKLNNIVIQYQHIEKGNIVDGYSDKKPANLYRLQCYTPQKLNCSCSVHWYKTHTEDVKTLVSSFIKWRERHIPVEFRKGYYWTTYKPFQELIAKTTKKIAQKKFLSCTKKATNDYRNCHVVGVFIQRFLNVPIAQFFKIKGVQIDEKEYALSELLQFVWRSNMRTENNTPVFVFIGSRQLFSIFTQWIKN